MFVYNFIGGVSRKDYYQEGNRVYNDLSVVDAYRKALKTWAKWIDYNINPKKSHVFFRGFSANHFKFVFFHVPFLVNKLPDLIWIPVN